MEIIAKVHANTVDPSVSFDHVRSNVGLYRAVDSKNHMLTLVGRERLITLVIYDEHVGTSITEACTENISGGWFKARFIPISGQVVINV